MFRRNLIPVWVGILVLSGMFLMGQDTWVQECIDNDGDGYGNPASSLCSLPQRDCDDSDPFVNPGATEGPPGHQSCSDGKDNDCDGFADSQDSECEEIVVDPCDPDPCQGIQDAIAGTCTPVGQTDFTCACDSGFDWDDATNTCEALPGGPMAQIPGGCFDMGDHFGEGDADELPVHNVCISAFEMDVHEVTNAEYADCVHAGGCTVPSDFSSDSRVTYYGDPAYDDFPVIWVDWYLAEEYCTWAGKRLPTEAEWEYAARGGLSGKRYPWGDTITGSDANYSNSGDPWDNDTSEVEYYVPNGYGLYDVAGNVYEWVNDWYDPDYYDVSPSNDPPGPASGTYRIMRGGSFFYTPASSYSLRVADRYQLDPVDDEEYFNIGFRCARGGAYGPPTPSLPDTGITSCYDNTQEIACPAPGEPFYGQDAQYVTNPMALAVNPDGETVTDNVTGLTWQREDDDTPRTWDNAISYCEGLTLADHSDWRLPDEYELQSIVDYGCYGPAINETIFPGTEPNLYDEYWSSSTSAYFGDNSAWYVSSNDGFMGSIRYKGSTLYVRCVRGESVAQSFTDNLDGTVTDNVTNLMWQREDDNQARNWESALAYCEDLPVAGHSDWRLPNIKELKNITDHTRHSPAIDPTYFPNTKSMYWSSSTHATRHYRSWGVGFGGDGHVHFDGNKADMYYYVRCVR